MAKRRTSIDLKSKNILFEFENGSYQVVKFYPDKMTVDIMMANNSEKIGIKNIPFAHLPKTTKKIIKPN